MTRRCAWVTEGREYLDYHDREWGVPVFDERLLFEMLTLEGAQAGLSWLTILKKRENYRRAFSGFDTAKIARYDRRKVERLMHDAGIVRHRLKIESTIGNARACLKLGRGGFSELLWSFVDGQPRINRWKSMRDVPAKTEASDAMGRELKRRGFRFVGSTTCYAFMQAVGMVNDHVTSCFRRRELTAGAKRVGELGRGAG